MNEDFNQAYNNLLNIGYSFSDEYKISYLTPEKYSRASDYLSEIGRVKYMSTHDLTTLIKIFEIYKNNYYKVKRLQSKDPRRIAQKFISKKNIRNFIFKRDGYRCLLCNSVNKLQIDHIMPISKNGENKISNLQTLCGSCNSRKSDSFADYRNNKIDNYERN